MGEIVQMGNYEPIEPKREVRVVVPHIPTVTTVPHIPTVTTVPHIPTVTTVPHIPTVTTVPHIPTVTTVEYIEKLMVGIDQPSLVIEEYAKGQVWVGVRERESQAVYFSLPELSPEEAVKLVAKRTQGKIDHREWEEVDGGLTKFVNRLSDVSKETANSVVSGIMADVLVHSGGAGPAIGISLVAAVASKSSFTAGMLGEALVASVGAGPAIVISLAVVALAMIFKKA